MKRKTHILLTILAFTLLTPFVGAQNSNMPRNVNFTIRYFDKEIYYPDSPLLIKAEIRNNSADIYRFQIADSRVYNFHFQAHTLNNQPLSAAQIYRNQRTSNKPVFFREVQLGPGEEYSFIMDLRDYIDIEGPGTFYVDSIFTPQVGTNLSPAGTTYRSNRLTLSIRPGRGKDNMETLLAEERKATLEALDLAPDEVIRFTLEALQEKEMQKFFLYLDLESLLMQDPGRLRRFKNLSEENRIQEIKRYQEDLLESRTEYSLMERPNSFEIIRTNYTPREGTVLVRSEFQYQDIIEIKEYTYHLEKQGNIWKVIRYDVQNIGSR